MKRKVLILGMVVLIGEIWLLGGCESAGQTGALLGAGAGALAGQAIGGDTKSTLIGAGIGGGVGYMIGSERDKKKAAADRESIRQQMNTVTVNITNSNGSITPVVLRKQGVGYIGPRGEYYNALPTPDQLKLIYGF